MCSRAGIDKAQSEKATAAFTSTLKANELGAKSPLTGVTSGLAVAGLMQG